MKINKNIVFALLAVLLVVLVFVVNNMAVKKEESKYLKGKYYAEISVKDYGKILLELDADTAPITVTNFMDLVNSKFYDGLTFHRIIKGFMIQGGDPLGNGTGGANKNIEGEFASNGITNNISHVRGTISMARASGNPNSASSQFFIVHEDSLDLDGNYAAFGKVLEGMDVVDEIAKVKVEDKNGTVLAKNQPVIEYIKEVKMNSKDNK